MARVSASFDDAIGDLEEAEALFRSEGRTHDAARVSARIGDVSFQLSKLDDALTRMTSSLDSLRNDEPDEDLAVLAAQLGRLHFFAGHSVEAADAIELALGVAESLWLPETISEAMNTKGLLANAHGRPEEALALIRRSLEVALENDTPKAALRAYFNLAYGMFERDRYDDARQLALEAIALARRLGWSGFEWFAKVYVAGQQFLAGEWDAVIAMMDEAITSDDSGVRGGASGLLREIGTPFHRACTMLEHAEWLVSNGRGEDAGPLLQEAAGIFARLRATPWIERVAKLQPDLAPA